MSVNYKVDKDALSEVIPPLTLQPIVENAIMHAFKDKENDCVLEVTIKKHQEGVYVGIKDNGKGMSKEVADQIRQAPIDSKSGNGLALYNVNRRLNILFGDETLLQVSTKKGEGTNIYFVLSYKEEEKQWIS